MICRWHAVTMALFFLVGCSPEGGFVDLPVDKFPDAFLIRIPDSARSGVDTISVTRKGQPAYEAITKLLTDEMHYWIYADPRITYARRSLVLIESNAISIDCGGNESNSTIISFGVRNDDPRYLSAPKRMVNSDSLNEAERARWIDRALRELVDRLPNEEHVNLRTLIYGADSESVPMSRRISIVKSVTCDPIIGILQTQPPSPR